MPLILQLAMDSVPNIRMNVAKTLEFVGQFLRDGQVEEALKKLQNDDDCDVRFYAEKTVKALEWF